MLALRNLGYYLDQQIPNPQQTFYAWINTWENFYNNEPIPAGASVSAAVIHDSHFNYGVRLV